MVTTNPPSNMRDTLPLIGPNRSKVDAKRSPIFTGTGDAMVNSAAVIACDLQG